MLSLRWYGLLGILTLWNPWHPPWASAANSTCVQASINGSTALQFGHTTWTTLDPRLRQELDAQVSQNWIPGVAARVSSDSSRGKALGVAVAAFASPYADAVLRDAEVGEWIRVRWRVERTDGLLSRTIRRFVGGQDAIEGTRDLKKIAAVLLPASEQVPFQALEVYLDRSGEIYFKVRAHTQRRQGVFRAAPVLELEQDGVLLHSIRQNQGLPVSAAFSENGRQILSSSDTGAVSIWDPSNGTQVHTVSGSSGWIESQPQSPGGRYRVSSFQEGSFNVIDTRTRATIHTFRGHTGRVTSASFSPNGRYIVSTAEDGTLRIWELYGIAHQIALNF